jgi:diacylglycerol kinase family enzyme
VATAAGRAAAVVLVNRRARRAGSAWEAGLRAALAPHYALDVHAPPDAASTTALAREAAAGGAALVVAAGGDGTASAVAAALAGTPTALGLLPLGTANDLARALGVPGEPGPAARRLAAGRVRAVDLVDVGGRPLCTVGGLGLVARSALAVCRLKDAGGLRRAAAQAIGPAIYRLSATAYLLREGGRLYEYEVAYRTPDGDRRSATLAAHGLFLTNQRFLGGGLALPGGAVDDDGAFELCFVLPAPRPRLADAFARLSLGLPIPDGVLRIVAATEATIRSDRDEAMLGDGDCVARGREFRLVARRQALRVVV